MKYLDKFQISPMMNFAKSVLHHSLLTKKLYCSQSDRIEEDIMNTSATQNHYLPLTLPYETDL